MDPECMDHNISLLSEENTKAVCTIGCWNHVLFLGSCEITNCRYYGTCIEQKSFLQSQPVYISSNTIPKQITDLSCTQHALGSSYLTNSSSWIWIHAGHCNNLGVYLSSEPLVHERSSCWSRLCHQSSSIPLSSFPCP